MTNFKSISIESLRILLIGITSVEKTEINKTWDLIFLKIDNGFECKLRLKKFEFTKYFE